MILKYSDNYKYIIIMNTNTHSTTKKRKLRIIKESSFIEVCAGAGGLSSGFINKGFKPLFLNEIDKTFCDTLKENHPNIPIINKSMEDLELDSYINNVDVLMGGVPCQSFSQAGKRKGLDDKRGNLILTFINMIHKLNPKIFLIENVKGLKTHNKGKTLETIGKNIGKQRKI